MTYKSVIFVAFIHAVTQSCSIHFQNIYIPPNMLFRGIDLALYKANGPDSAHDFYLVYILVSSESNLVRLAAHKIIEAGCNGWQIFHLKQQTISELIHDGENNLTVQIIMSKNFGSTLPCEGVHSVFLMNTTAHKVVQPPVTSTELDEGIEEEYSSGVEPTSNDDSVIATTESPLHDANETIMERLINTFMLLEEDFIVHIPILNMFVDKLRKRDVDPNVDALSPPEIDSMKSQCRLTKKIIHLESIIQINNETLTVLAPKVYDIGECGTSPGDSHQTREVCLPRKYRPVELLVSRVIDGEEFVSIYESPKVMLIEECG